MQKLLKQKGFTLVEFMVAILVFAIAGTLIFEIFSIQYRFFTEQQEFVDMDTKMNAGLRIMLQDIQLSDAGSGLPPIGLSVTSASQIELFSDRNGNSMTPDAANEDIVYRLDGPTKKLFRTGITLMDNVNSLQFKFFDKAGNEINPAAITALNQQFVTMIKVYVEVESKVKPVNSLTPRVRSLMAGARILSRQ